MSQQSAIGGESAMAGCRGSMRVTQSGHGSGCLLSQPLSGRGAQADIPQRKINGLPPFRRCRIPALLT
jgi:hypothetical protein